jgi:hypothetical protein
MSQTLASYESYFNSNGIQYHYKITFFQDHSFVQKIFYEFSNILLCDFQRKGVWMNQEKDEFIIIVENQISNSNKDEGENSVGKNFICKLVPNGILAPNEDGTLQILTKI